MLGLMIVYSLLPLGCTVFCCIVVCHLLTITASCLVYFGLLLLSSCCHFPKSLAARMKQATPHRLSSLGPTEPLEVDAFEVCYGFGVVS